MHLRILALLLSALATTAAADDVAADHDHVAHGDHDSAPVTRPLGLTLDKGWLDPWPHADLSHRGTPFVHLFNLEPAYLDRSLIVGYRYTDADGAHEDELEGEIEWALTRRIGLVVEAPYIMVDPNGGPTERGIGDTTVAGRFLLAEFDRLLLSANLGLSLPTGSENRGLGSGEVGIEPSVSLWLDLGHWVTASAQVGTEHGTESGDDALFYNAAVTWSFRGPSLLGRDGHGHPEHLHFPPGMTSLILEFSGNAILDGTDQGRVTHELILGASYNLTEAWEIRGGYRLPLGRPRDFDSGYVISLLRHF